MIHYLTEIVHDGAQRASRTEEALKSQSTLFEDIQQEWATAVGVNREEEIQNLFMLLFFKTC